MSPYFDSKAKLALLRNLYFGRCRYYVFDGFSGDGESVEVECVQDHVRKANQYGDNDSQRDCAAGESFVLMFLLIAQQFSGIKEISGHNQGFEVF